MTKKMMTFFVMLVFISGCATMYPPPPDPVCAKPEAAGSVICSIAQRLNMSPEQIDAIFLDAALVGIGTKVIKAEDMRAAVKKTMRWVDEKKILTINGLTQYLVKEATIDPALAMLLSRRLGLINLPDLGIVALTDYDVGLVTAGLQHQLDQLAWF